MQTKERKNKLVTLEEVAEKFSRPRKEDTGVVTARRGLNILLLAISFLIKKHDNLYLRKDVTCLLSEIGLPIIQEIKEIKQLQKAKKNLFNSKNPEDIVRGCTKISYQYSQDILRYGNEVTTSYYIPLSILSEMSDIQYALNIEQYIIMQLILIAGLTRSSIWIPKVRHKEFVGEIKHFEEWIIRNWIR